MAKAAFSLVIKNFYHGKYPVIVSPSFNLSDLVLRTVAVPKLLMTSPFLKGAKYESLESFILALRYGSTDNQVNYKRTYKKLFLY